MVAHDPPKRSSTCPTCPPLFAKRRITPPTAATAIAADGHGAVSLAAPGQWATPSAIAVLPLIAAALLAQGVPDLEQTCGPTATGVLQLDGGETWCFYGAGDYCRADDLQGGRCPASP